MLACADYRRPYMQLFQKSYVELHPFGGIPRDDYWHSRLLAYGLFMASRAAFSIPTVSSYLSTSHSQLIKTFIFVNLFAFLSLLFKVLNPGLKPISKLLNISQNFSEWLQ